MLFTFISGCCILGAQRSRLLGGVQWMERLSVLEINPLWMEEERRLSGPMEKLSHDASPTILANPLGSSGVITALQPYAQLDWDGLASKILNHSVFGCELLWKRADLGCGGFLQCWWSLKGLFALLAAGATRPSLKETPSGQHTDTCRGGKKIFFSTCLYSWLGTLVKRWLRIQAYTPFSAKTKKEGGGKGQF